MSLNRTPKASSTQRTLRGLLARYHFGITLLAVALSWCAILFAGATALRSYAGQNLALAAQLASYGAEPGLVFNDADAAHEAILPLLQRDGIARLQIFTDTGNLLLDEQSGHKDPNPFITQLLVPDPAISAVFHNGQEMGRVQIWGDSSALIDFVKFGLLAGLACLGLTAIGTQALARRLDRDLVKPLSEMAEVAHMARLHRQFDERIAPLGVVELDRLGSDINALFEELHSWQGQIENETALLTHRALHDTLTSLPNRAAFDEQLRKRIELASHSRAKFALIFMDADNFKQANDIYGHAVGDLVLIEISQRIKSSLRKSDFAARLGGDEFVVIIDAVKNKEEITQIVQNMHGKVGQPIQLPDGSIYQAGVSIGHALYPEEGSNSSELLTAADAAMYCEKFNNRMS